MKKKKSIGNPLQATCEDSISELAHAVQFLQNAATVASQERGWYYVDESGETQGPFASENMNGWHEAGYLDGDVMVTFGLTETQNWVKLGSLYPEAGTSFKGDLKNTVLRLIERIEEIKKLRAT